MANEKKVNGTESAAVTEQAAGEERRLIVEREEFTSKDGRKMWGYAVHGKVRGRETQVDFSAYDAGGYEVLDMVFGMKPTAELEMHEEAMSDGDTGEVRKYTVYSVSNVDEDGDKLTCRVKPTRDSDKSILAYLLKKLNRKANADKAEVSA